MGNPKLMSNVMEKIPVPIPSLSEQERIVSILEKLSTLSKEIIELLPTEIEMRQKQYEYYRDKLLTFN
jgi:type I restriction enzyme S subunit